MVRVRQIKIEVSRDNYDNLKLFRTKKYGFKSVNIYQKN